LQSLPKQPVLCVRGQVPVNQTKNRIGLDTILQ
jgi:hypothetical protein